jgi:magnesium chelatase subunit H
MVALAESILAKRRGYGTIVSYNVPPYGRAGLYLELANLKELVEEYRATAANGIADKSLSQSIFDSAQRTGMVNDVPLLLDRLDKTTVFTEADLPDAAFESGAFGDWILRLTDYLSILQDRLFSSGLRYATCVFGIL